MTQETKDKYIGTAAFVILFALVIASFLTSDVSGSEIDHLKGHRWLLVWGAMTYLPVFPIVSIFLSFPMGLKNIFEVLTINAVLTLVFTLFAWVLHFQYVSWTLLLIGNIVFLACMMYDERNKQKNNK